jgi:hypothetical protein
MIHKLQISFIDMCIINIMSLHKLAQIEVGHDFIDFLD